MHLRTLVLALAVCLGLPGCGGGGLMQYIVATRNHQGDLALAAGNLPDAAIAYKLALQFAPDDQHARAGLARVQLGIAVKDYQAAKLEDALAALAVASKYDPQSVRVAEVRAEIEQARIKREIVVSNYPIYRENGRALRRAYLELKTLDAKIIEALQRFDYTFDPTQLSTAIRTSYTLGEEVTKNTNHLISFRQLVEAGSPSASSEPLAPGASLLPLP